MFSLRQRLKTLTEPPRVGETYLVPTVWYLGLHIPVMGTVHSDPVLGPGAAEWHIHVDQRFVRLGVLQLLHPSDRCDESSLYPNLETFSARIFVVPCHGDRPPSPVRQQPMVCLRDMPRFAHTYVHQERSPTHVYWFTGDSVHHFGRFEDMYEGSCLVGPSRVCPHRGIPLASIPEINGIVTCPGHCLDFDARSGLLRRRTIEIKGQEGLYRHRTIAEGVVPCIGVHT